MIVSIKSYLWQTAPEANVVSTISHDVNVVELVRPLPRPTGKSGAFYHEYRVYRSWEMHPQTRRWTRIEQPQWPS